jgi:hypothetical protein
VIITSDRLGDDDSVCKAYALRIGASITTGSVSDYGFTILQIIGDA